MNIQQYREFCIKKKGVTEEFPFDQETLVFKVCGKIFALTNVDSFSSLNLKCDPEEAVILREKYPCVQPGYHMNKKHLNTILLDGSVPDKLLLQWIDDSYHCVVKGLPTKDKLKSEM